MRRVNNQDALIAEVESPSDRKRKNGDAWRGHLFMVADGMGAHAAGELASKLAIDSVPHAYRKQSDSPPQAALRQAVHKANRLIYAKGQSSPEFQGMGTTCSCLVLLPTAALVAHVGDSRVYRLRDERLEQLTFDHSLVWELAAASHITADKVPACIPKNVITRSLGPHEQVTVDLEGPFDLADGDTFLVCSDGLTAVVDDQLMGAVLGALPPQEAVQTLVDIANLRGGPDNISVIVTKATDAETSHHSTGDDPETGEHQAIVSSARPIAWAIFAACLAATAWFAVQQDYAWASVAAAGVGAAAVAALTQQRDQPHVEQPSAPLGGPYGDGPYRTIDCHSGEPAAKAIGAVVEQLAELETRDPAEAGPPIDDWKTFHQERHHGLHAADNNRTDDAIRHFSAAIRSLMDQVRANRTVDYAPNEHI